MYSRDILALAATLSSASAAAIQGFNYGAETDFATAFATQKALAGTNGAFTSARLYTTVDPLGGPTSAIPAAINSGTTLLLGIWASAGQANIDNEIAALKQAINTYGSAFAKLVTGISVGSEDLYRDSVTGIINKSGIGAAPADIVSYISQVRAAVAGTVLASAPIGHVDTWTAYVNGSNSAVITACDFLGVDAYPYFQNTQANGIENGASLFFSAYDQTVAVAQGKPVWVTETGWPASGPTSGQAVPSTANAQTYWDQVGCKLFGTTNTYWYTLNDNGAAPSFGVTTGSTTPLYNLTCPAAGASSSSSSAAASSSTSAVASSVAGAVTSSSAKASVSSSAAASVSAATSSQSAVPTQVGGGSPQDTKSAGGDSSAAASKTASPSAYSSAVASASSAASAASTMSLSTTTGGAIIRTSTSGSAVGTGAAASSAHSSATGSASSSASRASAASGTSTSAPATYTGAAATQSVGSLAGIVGAIFAAVALF